MSGDVGPVVGRAATSEPVAPPRCAVTSHTCLGARPLAPPRPFSHLGGLFQAVSSCLDASSIFIFDYRTSLKASQRGNEALVECRALRSY